MAISKVIFKSSADATPEVWMDTTDKTADSGNMLNGITALKNDGTTATGNIASKTSSDLTVSGATVTAPAGYYASSASKSVSSGSATTPATTITANPTISVGSDGLITATASATKSVTPTVSAGYVSSGTAGTITVSGSNTSQLTTQAAQTIHPATTDQTIASGKYLTGAQTIKAVTTTNLVAANIVSGVTVKVGDTSDDDCVASVTGSASSGGYDETIVKGLLERSYSFTSFTFPSGITTIGDGAFWGCAYLALTELPNTITTIKRYAFYGCSRLALTSLPSSLTTLDGDYIFRDCSEMALTSLPSGLTGALGNYCFFNCNQLALTSLPSGITRIGNYCFQRCSSLAISTLPDNLVYIGTDAFRDCNSITSISGNGAFTTISSGAFNGSSTYPMAIQSASFPNFDAALAQVFGSSTAANACQQLNFVDCGNASTLNSNSFANCYALQTLVLRRTSAVCALSNVNAFTNTPMQGYNSLTGTVYVPNDLIASYRSATNWSTLYNNGTVNFVKIESSIYDLS